MDTRITRQRTFDGQTELRINIPDLNDIINEGGQELLADLLADTGYAPTDLAPAEKHGKYVRFRILHDFEDH